MCKRDWDLNTIIELSYDIVLCLKSLFEKPTDSIDIKLTLTWLDVLE